MGYTRYLDNKSVDMIAFSIRIEEPYFRSFGTRDSLSNGLGWVSGAG